MTEWQFQVLLIKNLYSVAYVPSNDVLSIVWDISSWENVVRKICPFVAECSCFRAGPVSWEKYSICKGSYGGHNLSHRCTPAASALVTICHFTGIARLHPTLPPVRGGWVRIVGLVVRFSACSNFFSFLPVIYSKSSVKLCIGMITNTWKAARSSNWVGSQ